MGGRVLSFLLHVLFLGNVWYGRKKREADKQEAFSSCPPSFPSSYRCPPLPPPQRAALSWQRTLLIHLVLTLHPAPSLPPFLPFFPPPSLPALGLSSSFNLGKADIYPHTSGKAAAVARLLPRLFLHPEQCVALFDDDNDLGMATLCQSGRRIAVSITHPSVQAYVAGDKRVETVSRPGILGSEEALERVLASLVA